jgi:perosamine synthetase
VSELIPLAGPSITELEVGYVADAARNAWGPNAGVYNDRFEKAFAEYVGRRHAIALPSCTAGLHLALLAAGVGPGDEVVLPDATWIASAAPVTYVGADPVFADIDAGSWCLDAAAFEAALTPRTKAVVVVDLYGGLPDMDAILAVADRHGVAVVEDAAEAIGSEHRGRRAGSFGLASAFSFHGSKTVTTGEGGMLVTDSDAVYERCRFLADHGRPPGNRLFQNTEIAHKYKMSSLQAALGLAQLERVEELVARKREVFGWYREALDGFADVALNPEPEGVLNAYWMVTAVADRRLGVDKYELLEALRERGIAARPFFNPLSSLDAYEGSPAAAGAEARNPVAYDIGARAVNLPSGYALTRDQVQRVAEQLREALTSLAAPSPRA